MNDIRKEQKNLVEFIHCLSIVESQASLLYKNISTKVDHPLIRALLEEVALDSQKHSTLLKGVSESIAHPKADQKECAKHDIVLQKILKLEKEMAKMQKITEEDLVSLNEELQLLEGQMGEEYYVLVQMKTLTFMMKQINQAYNIDLTSAKRIFTTIISDEERHIELLETIKKIALPAQQARNGPLVKFQNPDAWYQPPATTL
jgi:hypothetical protein